MTHSDLLKKLSVKDIENALILNPFNHQIPFLFESKTLKTPNWILMVAASIEECESILNQNKELIDYNNIKYTQLEAGISNVETIVNDIMKIMKNV